MTPNGFVVEGWKCFFLLIWGTPQNTNIDTKHDGLMYLLSNMASFWVSMLDFGGVEDFDVFFVSRFTIFEAWCFFL